MRSTAIAAPASPEIPSDQIEALARLEKAAQVIVVNGIEYSVEQVSAPDAIGNRKAVLRRWKPF